MNPLVSIVIPVYKVEKYLKRCVESLVAQTYTNIEILLIDDGSPDRSGQISEELAKEDSRIRVFHKVNGGQSDARNYGTARANGDFIAFVDSDDFVAENYIERMMSMQRMHNADIVCCDYVRTSQDFADFAGASREDLVFTGREACRALMGQYYMPLVLACCKLYRREIAQKNPFPVGKIHEDEAFNCRFLYAADKVVLCDDKLYGYYVNPNSTTQDGKTSDFSKKLWALSARAEFFDEVGEQELGDIAWSRCVRFLVNHVIIQGKSVTDTVTPFVREHGLRNRLDAKTCLKVLIARFIPGILRKRINGDM